MATLTGNSIASTYTGLLSVSGAVGADTVEAVTDGAGTSTSLSLSQQRATITLGSGAGDDFIVDGTTLVVEGDNNRVGIGTDSPFGKLQVAGDISLANTATGSVNYIGQSNGGTTWTYGTRIGIGRDASGDGYINFTMLESGVGDNTPLYIDGNNGGRVGIGTTSPSEKLTVTGGICQNTGQPTASNGQFVHFNTGSRTVTSSTPSTVTLLTRSPNAEVASTGTCYLACENSGGTIQFGVIIDFFYSNGTLQTTARETGSSQGTTSVSIAESGNDLAISVTYTGGLGGAIKYTAAGHAVNASY